MCDRIHEFYEMRVKRKLVPVEVIETRKRDRIMDVRTFIVPTAELDSIVVECNRDPKVLLKWVSDNISYTPDANEWWNFPSETLDARKGDCEDGTILLANLLLRAGYPYYKVLISVYGQHVVVVFDGQLYDWTHPDEHLVQPDSRLSYCFNEKRAYTTKEHVEEWKK